MIHPDNAGTKTEQPVIDILQEDHPDIMVPDLTWDEMAAFKEYEELLETAPVDCDAEIVEETVSKLRGGAVPIGVDATAVKNWLLWHGQASKICKRR